MKRPRTIFGPFALIAILAIGFALGRMESSPSAPALLEAELTKGSKEAAPPVPDPRTDAREGQRARARLMIPVAGVTRRDLADTWGDARSAGRAHEGIDIIARQGTRVVAVADGRIVKFFDSDRGGVTIYQFDQTDRFVFYYAHLSARAAGLLEGDYVRQGTVLGYVGMTGNAPVPHLHFEIQRLGAQRRWWEADSMNPYPFLMTGRPPA